MQIKVSPPDVNQNDLQNGAGLAVPNMAGNGRNDMPYNVSRTFQIVVTDRNAGQLQKQIAKVIETALSHGAQFFAQFAHEQQRPVRRRRHPAERLDHARRFLFER